uniref:Uncharacterized protein n=1 Tax=Globodera rostochiensis TaxID=31243 RepID=A0A914I2A6_GLORO
MNSFALLIIAVGIAMMAMDVTLADDCCLRKGEICEPNEEKACCNACVTVGSTACECVAPPARVRKAVAAEAKACTRLLTISPVSHKISSVLIMFSIISIFILLLSGGTLSPTVATPNQEDESASRSDSMGSDNSDNTFSVSQVYAELYPPAKASNPANSGNSTFFNDQQPLQKSLSFKAPKPINSENDAKMRNILTDWCINIPNTS